MRPTIQHSPRDEMLRVLDRVLIGAGLLLLMLLVGVQLARAA